MGLFVCIPDIFFLCTKVVTTLGLSFLFTLSHCFNSQECSIKLSSSDWSLSPLPHTQLTHILFSPRGASVCTLGVQRFLCLNPESLIWEEQGFCAGFPLGSCLQHLHDVMSFGDFQDWFCFSYFLPLFCTQNNSRKEHDKTYLIIPFTLRKLGCRGSLYRKAISLYNQSVRNIVPGRGDGEGDGERA